MNDLKDRRRIITSFNDSGGIASIGEIERATGIRQSRVERLLEQLGGDVSKMRGNRWRLKKRH